MPYVGKNPTIGNFVKLDTITTTATTTFNLLNGGVAYYPQSPNHCLVSLNGILQAPTDSFTISGSTIIFSSALTTSDVIDFIIVLGDVLNIGTPSDNTVSLAKLTATGTKDATTFLRGDNTFQTIGANTPAFSATTSGNQTGLANNTITKLNFATETFDSNSAYDTTTSKFTVPSGQGGKYLIIANPYISWGTGSNATLVYGYIYKNGSATRTFSLEFGGSSAYINEYRFTMYALLDLAVSDYIEIYGRMGGVTDWGNYGGTFDGFKLI